MTICRNCTSVFLLSTLAVFRCGAQSNQEAAQGTGPSVSWGIGQYAVVDKSISSQRYDGTAYFAGFAWRDYSGTRTLTVGLSYLHSHDLHNFTVPASVEEPRAFVDILYPTAHFPFFGRPATFSLGPSIDLFGHYRREDIAQAGNAAYSVQSFIVMFSARLDAELLTEPFADVVAAVRVQASALSLAARNSSFSGNSGGFSLLTVPDAIRFDLRAEAGYRIFAGAYIRVAYLLDITQLSDVSEFDAASSTALVTLSYGW